MPIQQVKTIQGQKRLLDLSGSVPTGNPVGTLLTTYKKIQPRNYLYCDGRDTTGTEEELRTHYPALYLYLGSNVLPDYRECVMVGAEQNTTDNIATHDVYAQGEFKDDQMQKIEGSAIIGNPSYVYAGVSTPTGAFKQGTITQGGTFIRSGSSANDYRNLILDSSQVTRTSSTNVTHGKQKAVYVYIKAVDGVDISDEDSFLTVVENYIDEKLYARVNIPQVLEPKKSFPANYALNKYESFQLKNVSGKTVTFDIYVYRSTSSFSIQIPWGTTDVRIQESCGYGRSGWTTIDQSTTETDIWNSTCKHYRITHAMGNDSVIGISGGNTFCSFNYSVS